MPTRFETVLNAKRALHKEEMDKFGHELEWLEDPSLIPEDVVGETTDLVERCFNLTHWMLSNIGDWSGKGYRRLSIRETFSKFDVERADRVAILKRFRETPILAYGPGLQAMGEIFAAVPLVAARDNKPKDEWTGIGRLSERFGAQLSRDGTITQTIIREYLWDDKRQQSVLFGGTLGGEMLRFTMNRLDPAKLKPDAETGITTVTPIDELLGSTNDAVHEIFGSQVAKTCVALQVKSPFSHGETFFGSTWEAFAFAAENLIYPGAELPDNIPDQAHPDRNYATVAEAGAKRFLIENS